MRIAIDTLGCKLNQAESESLAWDFVAAGHEVVADIAEADIYILNTCSVTATADAKARQRLRNAHLRNPNAFIVAMGCYVEREPKKLLTIDGVRLAVSNMDKPQLMSLLRIPGHAGGRLSNQPQRRSPLRTRAFVKVQDGCDGACTYCIVPKVRPAQVSIPLPRVLTTIRQRFDSGIKEVVITGTEVGSYASDGLGLKGLLESVLADTEMPRIRVSSLQPLEITDDLLALWSDERMCPHFHVSIQSGSDPILHLMKRRYSARQFAEAVSRLRATVPDAAITTDVIVGFPGETEELFEESLEFCAKMQFARIHVFPYSPRPGTAASAMNGTVDETTKRRRSHQMIALGKESAARFRQGCRGKNLFVLWEQRRPDGAWSGLTGNYLTVTTRSTANLQNTITSFTLD